MQLPVPQSWTRSVSLATSLWILLTFCAPTISGSHGSQVRPAAMWLGNELKPQDIQAYGEVGSTLLQILRRVGPDLKASSDYHDFNDIHLNETLLSWRLMHDQSRLFAESQVDVYRPYVESLLNQSNVSSACYNSVRATLDSLRQLDSWAVQAWSATGTMPPSGILDGQMTEPGSYRGCLDLNLVELGAQHVKYMSYCTMSMRPIVPPRPQNHRVFQREPKPLIDLFPDRDVFNSFAKVAQYFHYLYMRSGFCVPYQCSHNDMQQVLNHVAFRMAMSPGPVKCYTKAPVEPGEPEAADVDWSTIQNQPVLVKINRPMNSKQIIATIVVLCFFLPIVVGSVWHALHLLLATRYSTTVSVYNTDFPEPSATPIQFSTPKKIAFEYLSIISNTREFLDVSPKRNEITCLHGLRALTMIWIITVHTFQYNEWSGFARVFENVPSLQNPLVHPIYNANYLVDNFFLMSGLLASYTAWFANKGTAANYSPLTSLLGRYLRLTPQVLLISMLYIILPLVGDGPFWYDMTNQSAKFCEKNWWINMLHLQAFYKTDEICNLVGWWISVDMFFFVISLGIIWLLLSDRVKSALILTISLVVIHILAAIGQHYYGGYPPNNLAIVPQVAEVWTKFVVKYTWSPQTHAYPFFLGLWIGHLLAKNKWSKQFREWSSSCTMLSFLALVLVNLSSRPWMMGQYDLNNQFISTTFNVACTIIWVTAFGWIIIACHYDCLPTLNRLLSANYCVLLSKASFIIYLSHMLLLRYYFGSRNVLLEVSPMSLVYIVVGNVVVSIIFGVLLCITLESSVMKIQKFIIQSIKRRPTDAPQPSNGLSNMNDHKDGYKESTSLGPTSVTLLK